MDLKVMRAEGVMEDFDVTLVKLITHFPSNHESQSESKE